jgi:hypothetical protein
MNRPQQAEAAMTLARRALELAQQNRTWPAFDRSLAAACEYAVRAVAVAWGDPRASRKRLAEFLRGPFSQFLNEGEADVVDEIWSYQEQGQPAPFAHAALMSGVKSIVEHLVQLAEQGPPAEWSPPTYSVVGWNGLSVDEQTIMLKMKEIALRYGGPDTHVYLHGARAKGQAHGDSDYDIYVVFPDSIDRYGAAYAMSDMNDVAEQYDVRTSRDWVPEHTWQSPDPGHETIVLEVRSYGIEVPTQ